MEPDDAEERQWLADRERAARQREREEEDERIDHLPFILREASRSVDELVTHLLARRGITTLSLTAVHALVVVKHPQPVVTLARRLRVSPQAAGRAVGELERAGLVEKWVGARDTRMRLVGRSEDGTALVRDLRDQFALVVSTMADAFSECRLGDLADELEELAMVDVQVPRW